MFKVIAAFGIAAGLASAQIAPPAPEAPQSGLKARPPAPVTAPYTVPSGTRILMSMSNTVSTKAAQPGDRIYLETAFPVNVNGRIVIPQGSYVTGTVTEVVRPGHVKGRGQLRVRFDTLM